MYRAALALVRGDAPAHHPARPAGDRPRRRRGPRHPGRRRRPSPGWRSGASGDLEAAHRAYSACVEGLQRAGHISDVLGCSITLADIRITQGRLGDALRTYEQALQLAAQEAGTVLRGTADMYVGMSQIACERGDLHAATAAPAAQPGAGRAHRAAAEPVPVAGRDGPGPGSRRAIWTARSPCSTRRSACTWATSPRTCGRSRRCGHACWPRRAMWAKPSTGPGSRACPPTTTSRYMREFEHITLARVLLARYATDGDTSSLHEAPGCWSACCRPPKRAAERAA